MKTLKIFLKPISYLLTFLILLQGCVIYKKHPVTIDEAVTANTNVRIQTKDDKTIKFKRIEFENGQYFGINKFHKEFIKTSIEVDSIENVKIKNKTMSIVFPIAVPMTFIGILALWASTYSYQATFQLPLLNKYASLLYSVN